MPHHKNQTDVRQKRRVIYDALETPVVLKRIIVEYAISAGELIEEYACYCVRNLGHIVIYNTPDVQFVMWWSNKRNYYMANVSIRHKGAFVCEERFNNPSEKTMTGGRGCAASSTSFSGNDDYIGRVKKQLITSEIFDLAFCFDNIVDALRQVMIKMMNANVVCA